MQFFLWAFWLCGLNVCTHCSLPGSCYLPSSPFTNFPHSDKNSVKKRHRGWDGEAAFVCVCMCDSPWACPHSEGNHPKAAAHTSPGLHLGGLEKETERDGKKIDKVTLVSSKKYFTVCGWGTTHDPQTGADADANFNISGMHSSAM